MSTVKVVESREELAARLSPFGQEHVLRFWDELDTAGRAQLAQQLAAIDLERLATLHHQDTKAVDWAALARRAHPPIALRIPDQEKGDLDFFLSYLNYCHRRDLRKRSQQPLLRTEAKRLGVEALQAGKIGVLLVAGGQGSRLGFEHPKGMFPIGPVSNASLLQIHFEKALAVARRYGASMPMYMMTSPITHEEQTEFLRQHGRFGLPEDDVVLFRQGTMPAVDEATGKLLLAAKDSLFLSPDGHGGTVAALATSGAIEHMRRRGVEHLFYLQVDNPLVPIGDAEFIGYHLLAQSELTSMAVAKQTPQDRLGVFAMIDCQMQVIEYSDMPEDVAAARDADGSLTFWAGSIAVHMFAVSFLERMLALKDALPFHIARKKVPYVNDAGQLVRPEKSNALKFERFIFDLMPRARNPLVVEFTEADVFAPLKNASGAEKDTPEYVKWYLSAQHRRWLEEVGTTVSNGVALEISPLWALDAEGVKVRADRPALVDRPTYLRDSS